MKAKLSLVAATLITIATSAYATPLTFTYDALGRMTEFTLPAGNKVNYTYDPNGNRTFEQIILQSAFDPDGDGVPIVADNCASKTNANQADVDKDGKGDVCDTLNWAQLLTGYYSNYGNQDGITTEQLMINHGLTNINQIGSINQYTDKLASNHTVTGVAFDPNSNRIYFSETWQGLIRHVDLATNQVKRDAGTGSRWLLGYVDGVGSNAKLNMPEQIAVSPDGQWIYIPDYANCVIRRMNTATTAVTTYAGEPSPCTVPYPNPSAQTYQDGPAATAKFYWPRGLAVDTDGTVYVGDSGNNAVRKISTSGIVSTLAGGPGNTIGMIRPDGVAIIGNDLYVADRLSRVVWKINKNTGSASVVVGQLHKYGLKTNVAGDQALIGCALAITGSGNLLFLTDDCQNAIYKIDISNNYYTTLLNPIRDWGFVDGPLNSAKFKYVEGISYDPAQQLLYIADFSNLALRRINLNTMTVSTILGLPETEGTYVDGDGAVARFSIPVDLAKVNDSTMLVADHRNCLLRKITLDPNFGQVSNGAFNNTVTVSTFAGQKATCDNWSVNTAVIESSAPVSTADTTSGNTAEFYRPMRVVVDTNSQYAYVLSYDRTIRRVDMATGATKWIAGKPLANAPLDGIGPNAQFNNFGDLIYVDEPALYILEETAVRRLSLHASNYGTVTTEYGHLTTAGAQDGTGTAARFTKLGRGVYLNRGGVPYLFVTDTVGNTVRKINLTTKAVSTIVGSGEIGSTDGIGTAATLHGPTGITAVTFPGNIAYLYIGDTYTPKLRVVDLDTLQVTTASGSGNFGVKDGIGGAADWTSLSDMVYMPTKNRVFVLDLFSRSIRQLTPDLPQ